MPIYAPFLNRGLWLYLVYKQRTSELEANYNAQAAHGELQDFLCKMPGGNENYKEAIEVI
jgi:hypothetical protein